MFGDNPFGDDIFSSLRKTFGGDAKPSPDEIRKQNEISDEDSISDKIAAMVRRVSGYCDSVKKDK